MRERAEAESDCRFRVDAEWVVDATHKVWLILQGCLGG